MDLIAELWHRALTPVPPPGSETLALLGLAALTLVLLGWRWVRLLVTITHEAGHALVALLTGRRLTGIRLHSDTSGLTLSRGRPRGPGMVLTLLAGYPAASAVGLAAAWLTGAGHAPAVLWLVVAVLAGMLLMIRNIYGAVVVLVVGGGLAAVSWWAPAPWLGLLAAGIAWLLLLAAPRPVLELLRDRRLSASDAAQLAAVTRVPALLWAVLWLAVTVGALVVGVGLMVPALAAVVG